MGVAKVMVLSEFIKNLVMARQLKFEEGRFEMFGIRAVIFAEKTFSTLIEELHERHGEEVYEIMYEMGRKQGHQAVEEVARKYEADRRQLFLELYESANAQGLGKIEYQEFDPEGFIKITLGDIPFAGDLKDELEAPERPAAEFMRGVYQGIGEEVFGPETVTEITDLNPQRAMIELSEAENDGPD